VQAMSDPSSRVQVSSDGGRRPRWTRSSDELIFVSKDRVMSVKFSRGGLNPSKPILLFEDKKHWRDFDVAADGRLVVAREADSNGTGIQINVVLGWFDELKREERK